MLGRTRGNSRTRYKGVSDETGQEYACQGSQILPRLSRKMFASDMPPQNVRIAVKLS